MGDPQSTLNDIVQAKASKWVELKADRDEQGRIRSSRTFDRPQITNFCYRLGTQSLSTFDPWITRSPLTIPLLSVRISPEKLFKNICSVWSLRKSISTKPKLSFATWFVHSCLYLTGSCPTNKHLPTTTDSIYPAGCIWSTWIKQIDGITIFSIIWICFRKRNAWFEIVTHHQTLTHLGVNRYNFCKYGRFHWN